MKTFNERVQRLGEQASGMVWEDLSPEVQEAYADADEVLEGILSGIQQDLQRKAKDVSIELYNTKQLRGPAPALIVYVCEITYDLYQDVLRSIIKVRQLR